MASNALRHPRLRSAPSTVVPAKAGNQGLGGATSECARPETTRTDCLCRRPRSSILIAHARRGTPSHPSSPTPTRDPPNVVPAKAGNQGLGGATSECARPETTRTDCLCRRPRSSILIAHARRGTPSHPSSPTPTRDPPNVVPAKAGNQGCQWPPLRPSHEVEPATSLNRYPRL